jgi:Fe-S-cluster containining protein
LNRPPNRTDQTLEIDLSELEGRTYRCIDSCALCCLCQPELLPDEEKRFSADARLAEGVASKHISPEVSGAAIKLRGAHGSCHFLQDKRCRIYEDRPHFCRSFPLNIFVGWRIQLNANLSCRGLGLPGESLEKIGSDLVSQYGPERLGRELRDANRVFADFVRNTRDAWVAQSFSSVRKAADALSEELSDELGLSRILTYAEKGQTRQNASPMDLARNSRKADAEADIEERALIDGTELFDLPDLSLLPVYIDQELTWKIFKLIGKEIVGYLLSEDGTTKEFSRTNPSDIGMLPMEAGGRKAFRDYLALVNRRDSFIGHAAYLLDTEGYEFNFGQVYLGAMATNAIDLWWRSSFLGHLAGKEALGPREIREGIIFFDMDLLDLPTIGAFI